MTADLPDFLLPAGAPPARAAAPATAPAEAPRADGHVPGEAGLWVFLLGDMTLFGAFFVAFVVQGRADPSAFADGAAALGTTTGGVNTLVLLTSSLLVAHAVRAVREGRSGVARVLLAGTVACGVGFAVLKTGEYAAEVAAGNTPTASLLFTYWFVLTGIHLFHVAVGLVLLGVVWWRLRAGTAGRVRTAEGAAAYWHMVDLLWLVLFALLYLGFPR